jgi:membrane-bound acyltransferase YfiQ involved in biofilm formation
LDVLVCAEEKAVKSVTKVSVVSVARSTKRATHYLFVDNLRFWSMLSIVAMHGTNMDDRLAKLPGIISQLIVTPFKFGTIAFFFASGFLLGGRIETSKPLEYLGRRLRRVFIPWTVWITLLTVLLTAVDVAHRGADAAFSMELLRVFGRRFLFCLTGTAFWFVPNLLIATSVLLLFRRHLDSPFLGLALLGVNLFYVVNIYACWLPAVHTEAVFGFVFYLWFGSYASRHYNSMRGWLQRTPMSALFALAVLTGALAFAESRLLEHLGSIDPSNTLRLSNQAFSMAVIFMVMKFRKAMWPRFVDVQRHTFGIYLSHTLLLGGILALIRWNLPVNVLAGLNKNVTADLTLRLVVTVFTYLLSLAVTAALAGTPRLQWLVGSAPPGRPAKQPLTNQHRGTPTSGSGCQA